MIKYSFKDIHHSLDQPAPPQARSLRTVGSHMEEFRTTPAHLPIISRNPENPCPR